MAQDLANCYRRDIRSLIISNATFVDPGKSASSFSTRRDLVIGLIGNLTPEKGLYEFIEIVRIAKARALPIRGVLAGPIVRDSDRIVLQTLKDELGEHLDYRGPVYHAEKARFFENIDVFVFPTTYLNEAQPTVIFEALANSVPIISFDRGCIRNQVGNAGRVFRGDANFVVEALLALDVYCGDPAMLAMHQHAARARYEVDRRAGNVQIAQLFDAVPSQVRPLPICES
jgi:glycosyltransferase involved in cell wall biosynthesis